MNKVEWEVINHNEAGDSFTQRMKVPGGWLLERIIDRKIARNTFIEDPNHEWLTPDPEPEEGVLVCPNCENPAFIPNSDGNNVGNNLYAGGHCLACKIRYCLACGDVLQTEDLGEKCPCGHFNEWESKL